MQVGTGPRLRQRPKVSGKFLAVDDEILYLRGVTYGAFQPGPNGEEYENLQTIESDFAMMVACGINAVRIPHSTPPRHVLDIAQRFGLWSLMPYVIILTAAMVLLWRVLQVRPQV